MFKVVTKAIIMKEGKFLLIKRENNSSFGGGLWDMPGGKLEFGELPEESLKREIKEETSINVKVNKVLYVNSGVDDIKKRQYITIIYLAEYQSGKVNLNNESSEYKWVDMNNASSSDNIYYVKDSILKFLNN